MVQEKQMCTLANDQVAGCCILKQSGRGQMCRRKSFAFLPAFFFFNLDQDDIGTDLADTFPGMMYSVSRPRKQQIFAGPGTMIAFTNPVQISISTSHTQPRERQVQVLITSFCRSSQIRIKSPHLPLK